jgi:carbon storage regulator CsrA
MLILTRKPGQEIFIGDDIVVKFIGKDPIYSNIKIGISAPPCVEVLRREVWEKNKKRNQDYGYRGPMDHDQDFM